MSPVTCAQMQPSIALLLSITRYFSMHEWGHLFQACVAYPLEQSQFSAQSLYSPNTDNQSVFVS